LNNPSSILLKGTGTLAAPTFSPALLQFPKTTVGNTSAPKPAPTIQAETASAYAVPVNARQIADLLIAGEGFEPSTSGL
jgi:hypothetical protein